MSVVTGFTLVCSVCEETQWAERPPANIDLINQWLETRHFHPLADSADRARGSKHPQFFIYVAGYNHFPEDDFSEYFSTLDWEIPECAVLIMQPETGSTRVFRPPPRLPLSPCSPK